MTKKERDQFFESNFQQIEKMIEAKRSKWHLDAVPHISFDDAKQKLLLQIYEKLHLYDQTRSFGAWLNGFVRKRFMNILRDNYLRFRKPCVTCEFDIGDNACAFTSSGVKCAECKLYKKWQKSQEASYNIKMTTSLETQENPDDFHQTNAYEDELDPKDIQRQVADYLKKNAPERLYRYFKLKYLEEKTPEQIGLKMGWKRSRKGVVRGYTIIPHYEKELQKILQNFRREIEK